MGFVARNFDKIDPPTLKVLLNGSEFLYSPPFNGQEKRRNLVEVLLDAIPFEAIVETGTFVGTTTQYLCRLQPTIDVYTSELNPIFHSIGKIRLIEHDNCHPHHEDSAVFLERISKQVADLCCFVYLDAHWGASNPLTRELNVIEGWRKWVVMIDDFAVEGDDGYGFDSKPKALNIECIGEFLEGKYAYFPSVQGRDETGFRRGCIVITGDPGVRRVLSSTELLREWTG